MCNICNQSENRMPAGGMQSEEGMPQSRMDSVGTGSMPNGSMVSEVSGGMPRFEMNTTADWKPGSNGLRDDGGGMPGLMSMPNAKGAMPRSRMNPGDNGRSVMPEPGDRN